MEQRSGIDCETVCDLEDASLSNWHLSYRVKEETWTNLDLEFHCLALWSPPPTLESSGQEPWVPQVSPGLAWRGEHCSCSSVTWEGQPRGWDLGWIIARPRWEKSSACQVKAALFRFHWADIKGGRICEPCVGSRRESQGGRKLGNARNH